MTMATSVITFANGETLELNEKSLIHFVGHFNNIDNESLYVSETIQYGGPVSLDDYHTELGLAPELVEYFHNSDYFFLHQDPNTIYSTNAIYKIESNLD
jgi:hypothetical protein